MESGAIFHSCFYSFFPRLFVSSLIFLPLFFSFILSELFSLFLCTRARSTCTLFSLFRFVLILAISPSYLFCSSMQEIRLNSTYTSLRSQDDRQYRDIPRRTVKEEQKKANQRNGKLPREEPESLIISLQFEFNRNLNNSLLLYFTRSRAPFLS